MVEQTGQLIIQCEGQPTQTFPLTMPVLSIGRGPESGLPLSDPLVSRRHAELRMGPQGPVLTDLGSANGTFIGGGERLLPNRPHVLADGATFRVGPYSVTYQATKSATTQVTEMQPVEPPHVEPSQVPAIDERTVPIVLVPSEPVSLPGLPLVSRPAPSRLSYASYIRYLPDIFQDNDFLTRFLHIFEDLWEPLEQRQDHMAMYFDPRTCPASFLPWLASWLDLSLNPHWPEARRRRILEQAMALYSVRGTTDGLRRMIEVCTGLSSQITEVQPFVFRVRITLRPNTSGEVVDRALIEELIQTHKPAHAGYILEVTP